MSGSRAEDTHAAVPSVVGVQKTEAWLGPPNRTIVLPQERYQLVKRDLRCLPLAMHLHTCLPWPIPAPSWPEGHGPQEVFGGL